MPRSPETQAKPAPKAKAKPTTKPRTKKHKTAEMVAMAESNGLLAGTRTRMIRGRMPAALVAEAKRKTGITSDSKLIEAGLASIAVEDNFWQWMIEHEGTIDKDLDLDICL